MDNPQERVIKKMISNIVEQNKPVFEKPSGSETAHAPATVTSHSSGSSSEEFTMLTRKIEYGFSTMRTENVELRKALDELMGAVKMIRNDLDGVRMTVQQAARGGSPQASPHHESAAPRGAPTQSSAPMGAPQYRKTEADEAYEKQSGQASHDEEPAQARGFQKKEDKGAEIDISKVFYYGKK